MIETTGSVNRILARYCRFETNAKRRAHTKAQRRQEEKRLFNSATLREKIKRAMPLCMAFRDLINAKWWKVKGKPNFVDNKDCCYR
jgi:hypothetical protein